MIEIAIAVILLGGAAWTTVRTYKGRGISSIFILGFAVFLVALGLSFLFGDCWRVGAQHKVRERVAQNESDTERRKPDFHAVMT